MKSKLPKIISGIVAVLLGVISSGLWELLFSPLIHSLASFSITAPAKISSVFGNYYVSNIASADREFLTIELRMWLLFFIVVIFFMNIKYIQKIFSRIPLFVGLFLVCFLSINTFIDIQISNTAHYTLQNIEIVSPYISEQDYKLLKSDFYSMQNMDDFNSLNQKLNSIADEYSLHLN